MKVLKMESNESFDPKICGRRTLLLIGGGVVVLTAVAVHLFELTSTTGFISGLLSFDFDTSSHRTDVTS